VFKDAAKLKALQDEAARLRADLAALEEEWLARSR
jgi:hypothetical protein